MSYFVDGIKEEFDIDGTSILVPIISEYTTKEDEESSGLYDDEFRCIECMDVCHFSEAKDSTICKECYEWIKENEKQKS